MTIAIIILCWIVAGLIVGVLFGMVAADDVRGHILDRLNGRRP